MKEQVKRAGDKVRVIVRATVSANLRVSQKVGYKVRATVTASTAAQAGPVSPGQPTSGLVGTQQKTAQPAHIRQAVPLNYFLLEND